MRGVHVAALQCTCCRRDTVRQEWVVKNRHGQPLFHCFSWRRDHSNVQSGVVLLLSSAFCDKEHIHWRLDPGQGAVGRFGGVRVVDRRSRRPHDNAFITAYAPQETAPESEKQAFFTQLQQTIHGFASSYTCLAVGRSECSHWLRPLLVSCGASRASNDNGINVAHLCASTSLALVNTFHKAGPTWWSPDRSTSHRLDQGWQSAAVRDHWPIEVHVLFGCRSNGLLKDRKAMLSLGMSMQLLELRATLSWQPPSLLRRRPSLMS